MKNRITAFLLIILAICTLFSVTALAADDITIDLSTISSYRGMKGEMKNGVLELDVIGYEETKESPSIFLPAMEIDADSYGTLELVMKSHTVTDKAKIHKFYFRTTELGYAEARTSVVNLENTDDYVTYTFNLSEHDQWSGKVTGLFYTMEGNVTGTASIKSITLKKKSSKPDSAPTAELVPTGKELPLDISTFTGFRGMNGTMNNGVLELEVLGYQQTKESPAIWIPAVSVDASKYRYVKVVMKSNTETTVTPTHNIYFKTDAHEGYAEARKVTLNINKTDDYVTYVFDMGAHNDWYGHVNGIFYQIEGDAKGTASIKSMSFVEGAPVKKIVLSEEEKITDLPENAVIKYESKFVKTRDYEGSFADVGSNDWFYETVGSAYEYGLVNGSSATTYEPNGTMTVAEAITLACRMYGVANGKTLDIKNGDVNWYDNYVAYAKSEGFVKDGDFDSYDREIKRYEMVTLFAAALPAEAFAELNYVTHIPDVSADKPYAKDILMFYNAGICMGNDIYGTFSPESNITRAEVAAIADRIADHSHRLDKDLAVKVDANAAYYIIDDDNYIGRNTISESIQSGWDFDNRGGMVKTDDEPPYSLSDISDKEPVTLTRNVTVQDAGVVTLDSSVKFNSKVDGWYAVVNSSLGLPVAKLYTEGGKFYVLDNGTPKALDFTISVGKDVYYSITMDLAAKTYSIDLNGADFGTYAFASAYATDIAQVKLGTTEAATMDTSVGVCKMYCNYLVNDYIQGKFIRHDWKVEQSGDMTVVANGGEFQFNGNEGKAALSKSFTPASGEIALDLIMLYPEMADGAQIALTSGGTPVVSFTTKDGKMYANGKELREYAGYMWYMVRLVADTNTQKALIKVSGKTVATDIPFATAASTIDGVLISSENNGGKIFRVDDIEIQKLPIYTDYPSEPEVPEGADDYYIGMNICNLWRNGYHWGWDNISPYDENKPYLGWYDEGLPEVADWEIKFMAEHGIDFQLVCWYHSGEKPMKTFYGSTPEAVFSGFMNAKYSDKYGKIALLWEAANGQKPTSLDDFKRRFVDFWVEYFFSDPRYMVIDNKLVMSIFGADRLPGSLGSTAAVKECFDYLREVVRGMGYDDIIIMACSGSSDKNTLKNLADMGIDAVHAYNWGNAGYSAAVNQSNIFNQQKNGAGIMHNVPTVSTGFNNIAWAYTRHPQLTTDNMKQVLTWVRDYALKNYEVTGEDDKWKQNFIMLSTWNEYGEGTYMMPSGLNGFGYVDTVREVFTKGGAHEDDRPDNLQMARLGHLYPINREIIRPDGYYEAVVSGQVLYEDTFSGENFAHWHNTHSDVKDEGDVLSGVATDHDPILTWAMPYGSLDAAKVKHIRVYVDGVVGNNVEVFWQREDDKTWTASKGTNAKITKEGMNPVVIDVGSHANWKGSITAFRVDPITSANPFKIQKIEFLGEAASEEIRINGQTLRFDVNPVTLANGDTLIPFHPDTGIGYQIGCAYTWDKVNKKLTLAKNGTTIVYTMGSDRASVNGTPVEIGGTVYLEDGLPMIPIMFTMEKFGCEARKTTEDGVSVINLITIGGKEYEILENRVPNKWEFDINGDAEGWTLQAATATVMDGTFLGDNSGLNNAVGGSSYDPRLKSPTLAFTAKQYKKLIIRMKHEIDVEMTDANKGEFNLVVYFTSSAGGPSEARTYRTFVGQNSGGEYKEYVFDLNHEQWVGDITSIWVDPFNNVPGKFWVDYIRFE